MRQLTRPGRPIVLAATIGLMGVIAVLSLTPGQPMPGDSALVWFVARTPASVQNVMHVVCYGVLAALWKRTFSLSNTPRAWLAAATITIVYGVLLEACQLLVPGRFGSVTDALLDALGAGIGLLASSALWPDRPRTGIEPNS